MTRSGMEGVALDRRVSRLSVVSYGAGTNSTAMLIGLHERGERPDLILFADTGGERPETYRHRDAVSKGFQSSWNIQD